MDITFEEKNERYQAANNLLKVTNYISDSELIQIKKIVDNCYERHRNLKSKGAWYER